MEERLIVKEVTKLGDDIDTFVKVVYKNFINLAKYEELKHTEKEIGRLLKSSNFLGLFVYNKKTHLVAYMLGEIMKLNDGRVVYYISYFYVAKPYRSKGIGSQMMNMIIEKCKSRKISYIMLTCDTEDTTVYDFYLMRRFMPDPILRKYDRYDIFTLYI